MYPTFINLLNLLGLCIFAVFLLHSEFCVDSFSNSILFKNYPIQFSFKCVCLIIMKKNFMSLYSHFCVGLWWFSLIIWLLVVEKTLYIQIPFPNYVNPLNSVLLDHSSSMFDAFKLLLKTCLFVLFFCVKTRQVLTVGLDFRALFKSVVIIHHHYEF